MHLPIHLARDRYTALSLVGGGAAWAAFALLAHSRPTGCVGDACFSGGAVRETGDLSGLLVGGAVLTVAALTLLARRARPNFALRAGSWVALAGTALLMLAVALPLDVLSAETKWWALVYPGALAVMTGIALSACGALRARVFAVPIGAFLLVSAIALFGFNDQDSRVLLLLPYALAACAAGVSLVARGARSHAIAA
jgi:hypothetical protein